MGWESGATWSSDMPGAKPGPKEVTAQRDGIGPCGRGRPIHIVPLGDHQQHFPALCDALIAAASTPPRLLPSRLKAKVSAGIKAWGNQRFINSCHYQNRSADQ